MSEPVKVTEPMMTPETSGDEHHDVRGAFLGQDVVQGHECGGATTPTVLNTETSCGMSVILTLLAEATPATAPMRMPDDQQPARRHCILEAGGEELDEGHEHGDDHAGRGDVVALAGGLRRIHVMQTDDEQDGGEQV